jgi:uncharacterized membrane protein YdjX (TVP38/TMEM64 family)
MGTVTFIVFSTAGRLLSTILLSVIGSSMRNHNHVTLLIILMVNATLFLAVYWYRNELLLMVKEENN